MGSRYYITGVQLGIILAFAKSKGLRQVENLVEKIIDEQYLGEGDNEYDMPTM